tara:strand:- start:394 stop:1185 length:792 start_codon:yes stop_codon:yes gene_type:complete
MSSIYKKGRDGYYYYQRYVYNPKTGKKDKRVFHSLGTKDFDIACLKKDKYDQDYLRPSGYTKKGKVTYSRLFYILIPITLLFFYEHLKTQKSNQSSIMEEKPIYNAKPKILSSNNSKIKVVIDKPDVSSNQDNSKDSNKIIIATNEINKSIIQKKSIPKYKIERIIELSETFKQAKIFVTVNSKVDNSSLKLLCDEIKKKNSQFSNIIICLYDNSKMGKKLANGDKYNVNNQEKQEAWIGMYTYNPVEGAYFDDNPGGYLGAY